MVKKSIALKTQGIPLARVGRHADVKRRFPGDVTFCYARLWTSRSSTLSSAKCTLISYRSSFFTKRDLETARGYFEKAAQLDAAYQLNLGRLYKSQEETARARACFEAFLTAKGSSPEYASMIPQVRQELASVQ
jgi:TPR repeat protein